MVRRGFSLGCHRCRAQHTRCDQGRPGCARCSAAGEVCLGYRDDGGFLFKDETKGVVLRSAGSGKPRKKPNAHFRRNTKAYTLSACTAPPPSIEDFCVHFFLDSLLRTDPTQSLDRGLYANIVHLHQQSPVGSPLRHAVTLLSGEMTALAFRCNYSSWHVQNGLRAVQAVREALLDQEQCSEDATLLATLLLQKADQINCIRHGRPIKPIHETGALALLQWRGLGDVPTYLVTSVRSSVLLSVVYGGLSRHAASEKLKFLSSRHSDQLGNSAVSLDHLMGQAMCLWTRVSTSPNPAMVTMYREESGILEDLLQIWPYQTPPSMFPAHSLWGPQKREQAEAYATMETALAHQQWRLTCSIAKAISRALAVADENTSNPEKGHLGTMEDLLHSLLTATRFFFDILKDQSTPSSYGRCAFGMMYLHLILQCLRWFCAQIQGQCGLAHLCPSLSEGVRKRSDELNELFNLRPR